MKNCIECNGPLLTATQKTYCSSACLQQANRKVKIADWLATGVCFPGSHKGHFVRTYIAEQQQELCAICKCPSKHNGLPLNFILDHIDGNSQDNSRDNLRLVCPNCDSQLDTFKSKNKGNGRHNRRERYDEGKSY